MCVLFYVSSVCVRVCVCVCVCVCVILQAGLNNFVIGKKCDNEKRSDVA